MRTIQNMWKRSVAIAAALVMVGQAQAAHLILQNGKRVEGSSVRLTASGDYMIKTSAGDRTFPKAQVREAVADKPAEYDKAMALVKGKKFDEAAPALEAIARKYRGVGWDDQANKVLAQIYLDQNDGKKAYGAAKAISEGFRSRPDVRAVYWQALLASDNMTELEKDLDAAIADASDRGLAARAQTMRGDIKMKRNQTEKAVLDYLRTVILFESEKDAQPEALFKAAAALQQLRDGKADTLFAKLKKDYPESKYASQAP